MDFALNDEQQMLQEAAQRFLSEVHPCTRARQALPWSDPAQQSLWKNMADMGWNALLVPEDQGGSNLGLVEASLIAESAGQNLLNLPWSSSAVLLVLLYLETGNAAPPPLRAAVESLVQGQQSWHCIIDSTSYWDFAAQCSNYVWVRGWDNATASVEMSFVTNEPSHTLLPTLDPTMSMRPAPAIANDWYEIALPHSARMRIRSAYHVMLASELVGIGQAALSMSTAYAKERIQFGKPIGSYQSIKHQLANMWMAVDNARLSVMYAAAALESQLPDQFLASAIAEYAAIEGAFQSTRMAVQVHGALGFTWEHDIHLYLKRAQHVANRLGGTSAVLSNIEMLALH